MAARLLQERGRRKDGSREMMARKHMCLRAMGSQMQPVSHAALTSTFQLVLGKHFCLATDDIAVKEGLVLTLEPAHIPEALSA